MNIETIHESLSNGRRKQMTEQIDEYGPTFWYDYQAWLKGIWANGQPDIYADAVISYHRVKGMQALPELQALMKDINDET